MEYKDFRITYTAEELLKYEQSYLLRKYFSFYKGIPGILILAAFIYFAVNAVMNGMQSVSKLALIVFGILLAAFIIVVFRVIALTLSYKTRYEGQGMLDKMSRIVLSRTGAYPDDMGTTPMYETAFDYYENETLFVIEVGDDKARRALIIPKRCCEGQKDLDFVRDCAKRMVENGKPSK